MKRKHTNEEHEEGEGKVVQSQTPSTKRRRVGNTRKASSASLDRNQAGGENAELIDMLMTRCLGKSVGNTRNASSGSLGRNQAEGENAELIDMLMTRCLYARVGNTRKASSGSLGRNQAEGENVELIS